MMADLHASCRSALQLKLTVQCNLNGLKLKGVLWQATHTPTSGNSWRLYLVIIKVLGLVNVEKLR